MPQSASSSLSHTALFPPVAPVLGQGGEVWWVMLRLWGLTRQVMASPGSMESGGTGVVHVVEEGVAARLAL